MFYTYRNKKGEKIEKVFPIGKAPDKIKEGNTIFMRDGLTDLKTQGFILKGSGWPGQTLKRKEQMTENNTKAGKRTKDTWGDPKKVVPNYKGEVCESWKEAKEVSKKDKDK